MVRLNPYLMIMGLCLFLSLPAQAHRLKVFAFAEGNLIEGSTYFVGGAPAAGASVEVQNAEGDVLATLNPDSAGEFSFQARSGVDHIIVANTGDGHIAEWTVSAAELTGSDKRDTSAPSTTGPAKRPSTEEVSQPPENAELPALVEQAVARQIRPLREQLVTYEEQVRLRDIVGGIGYILGLAGLAAWWQQRRRHKS